METRKIYVTPLGTRYASHRMQELMSENTRVVTYRRIWIAVLKAYMQMELMINNTPIRQEQIDELKTNIEIIDYARVAEIEKTTGHDVMAHIEHYGEVCPSARGFLHIGLTSCDVTDNADLVVFRDATKLICVRLAGLLQAVTDMGSQCLAQPIVARTHGQPATMSTLGKRFAMYASDLASHLRLLKDSSAHFPFRGMKGATGTQASFLQLLYSGESVVTDGRDRVLEFEKKVAAEMGFEPQDILPTTGQTYSRIIDLEIVHRLASLAATLHKMAVDNRLSQMLGEIYEPKGEKQTSSSAMPHKDNPNLNERVASLARRLLGFYTEAWNTSSQQWLERSLDDSAARRMYMPEAFLLLDGMLMVMTKIFKGLRVYPKRIQTNVDNVLPFMAVESLMMRMVEKGADRQEAHGRLREKAKQAAGEVWEGRPNNLLRLIGGDSYFAPIHNELSALVDPKKFVGLAEFQALMEYSKIKHSLLFFFEEELKSLELEVNV